MSSPRVLVLDNYDSFVYNLVQYLGDLGAEPLVHRNDALDLDGALALGADALVISPGPGGPPEAGISCSLVRTLAGKVPVLGVCLGHQCIAAAFGGSIVRVPVVHGRTSTIAHDGKGVFAGVDSPLVATRYHSLAVDPSRVPAELEVTARSEDGTIMGLRHRDAATEGLQFHPESVLTTSGRQLLSNWLAMAGSARGTSSRAR